ncbi:MAG TPA: hypothetical protein DCF63_05245, partial [Planctomycetaceae bacterium]|nr:hypothetical protein [Planctomycetaceae bacterium]
RPPEIRKHRYKKMHKSCGLIRPKFWPFRFIQESVVLAGESMVSTTARRSGCIDRCGGQQPDCHSGNRPDRRHFLKRWSLGFGALSLAA